MNYKLLAILAAGLLARPMAALADLVQSSTTVNLTFRDCINDGTSDCDSV